MMSDNVCPFSFGFQETLRGRGFSPDEATEMC